jgi:hypothetical protein
MENSTSFFTDNQNIHRLPVIGFMNPKTRHIALRLLQIIRILKDSYSLVKFLQCDQNTADILTKGLAQLKR